MNTSGCSTLERRHVQETLSALGDQATAVILVGSRARGVGDASSDIDLLVVGSGRVPEVKGGMQIIQTSETELADRLMSGDDFVVWVFKYGKPIRGHSRWRELKERLSMLQRWPDPTIKWRKARTHWKAARSLLSLGDSEAAAEEARIALSHLARALLLEREVFPLSRPELAKQLESVGEGKLAKAFTSSNREVRDLLELMHSYLLAVDPSADQAEA